MMGGVLEIKKEDELKKVCFITELKYQFLKTLICETVLDLINAEALQKVIQFIIPFVLIIGFQFYSNVCA